MQNSISSNLMGVPKLGQEPPTRVLLWRWGANVTAKGTFWLTKNSVKEIINHFNDRGNPLVFDVDHLSLEKESTLDQKIAIGFAASLLADDVGLWADNVTWTQLGYDLIKRGGFLFDSPVVLASAQNVIRKLIAGSITNRPAKNNAQPLLFSIGDTVVDEEQFKNSMKPLRDIQFAFGMILNSLQECAKMYSAGDVSEFAKSIGAQVPDWSFSLNKLIDTLDPDGKSLPKSEEEEEKSEGEDKKIEIEFPVANSVNVQESSAPEKSEEVVVAQKEKTSIGDLLSFSKDIFKLDDENPLSVKASILALSDNNRDLIEQVEKFKNDNLRLQKESKVNKGIIEHKILFLEKDKFLQMSDTEIDTYLKFKTPRVSSFENIQQPETNVNSLNEMKVFSDYPEDIKKQVDKIFEFMRK